MWLKEFMLSRLAMAQFHMRELEVQLKEQSSSTQNLAAQHAILQTEGLKKASELEALRAVHSSYLQATQEQVAREAEAAQELRSQLSSANSSHAAATSALESLKSDFAAQATKMASVTKNFALLQLEHDKMSTNLAQASSQLEAISGERDSALNMIAGLQVELAESLKLAEVLKLQVKNLTEENTVARVYCFLASFQTVHALLQFMNTFLQDNSVQRLLTVTELHSKHAAKQQVVVFFLTSAAR